MLCKHQKKIYKTPKWSNSNFQFERYNSLTKIVVRFSTLKDFECKDFTKSQFDLYELNPLFPTSNNYDKDYGS